jgi:hypothetical protein
VASRILKLSNLSAIGPPSVSEKKRKGKNAAIEKDRKNVMKKLLLA